MSNTTIPYPFNQEYTNPEGLEVLKAPWVALIANPGSRQDPPRIQMDPERWTYRRGEEQLQIVLWYSPRESRSGGHTCHAILHYRDGNGLYACVKGRAGGCGYCKSSAAIADALGKLLGKSNPLTHLHGCGMSSVRDALEFLGWQKC